MFNNVNYYNAYLIYYKIYFKILYYLFIFYLIIKIRKISINI